MDIQDGRNVFEVKIEVRNIEKSFKNNQVIQGIDMTFASGHVYGIVGRNGSGKSVFLNILLGFMRQTSGEICFERDGENYAPQIAAVLDGSDLYPDMSAKENLVYLSNFRKLIGEKEIDEVLKKVELSPENPAPIKTYSTGMRKRLLIAQAIMEPADIVIMDEPTNGLDDSGVELLYKLVAEMKDKGMLVLITSHSKEDIHVMCDTVYRMKEGKLWQENME